MKLILARHGDAEQFSESGRDRDRKLTKQGREDIRKMGRFIKFSSLRVNQIYHSPYERTKETAEIFSDELGLTSPLASCDDLAPENECDSMLIKIKDFSNSETILIVSHNPGIAQFAAQLIQNEILFPSLPFSPGTTLAINVPREHFQRGQILWMISPYDLNTDLFLNTHS